MRPATLRALWPCCPSVVQSGAPHVSGRGAEARFVRRMRHELIVVNSKMGPLPICLGNRLAGPGCLGVLL